MMIFEWWQQENMDIHARQPCGFCMAKMWQTFTLLPVAKPEMNVMKSIRIFIQ
jgi:hypothetical protein